MNKTKVFICNARHFYETISGEDIYSMKRVLGAGYEKDFQAIAYKSVLHEVY